MKKIHTKIKHIKTSDVQDSFELFCLMSIFLISTVSIAGQIMAWLEKAVLDISNAHYEPRLNEIIKDFIMENTWNTPFIIKTGSDAKVRATVSNVLDNSLISHTFWRENEIEIVDV